MLPLNLSCLQVHSNDGAIPYAVFHGFKCRLNMTFSWLAEKVHSLIGYSHIDILLIKGRIRHDTAAWTGPDRSTAIWHCWNIFTIKNSYICPPDWLPVSAFIAMISPLLLWPMTIFSELLLELMVTRLVPQQVSQS